MLKINNISKIFYDGKSTKIALRDVTLELSKGTFAAIVGPSGSGKSTLLTIMGALQRPTSGSIEMNGINIYDVSENKRSDIRFNDLGFVLQGSNLIPFLTVEEQFKLKLSKSASKNKEDYKSLLKKLGIIDIRNKYPDEISGGERQRVAIALSLILNPSIILADEPTASLDTDKAYEVVKLLKEITKNRNTTFLMVTHDTRMLSYCDRVFEIIDGNMKELEVNHEIKNNKNK